MLASTKFNQKGLTIVELAVSTAMAGLLVISAVTVMLYFYGDVVRSHSQASLAVEAQNVLRAVVEDIRVSSGIRDNNTIADTNAPPGGWTTSNADLILIVSTPAFDSSNEFIINPVTGYPYQNEIVYFTDGLLLYQRTLAHPLAVDNQSKTSCPKTIASSSCPPDVLMSSNFENMLFTFYDQDDAVTASPSLARSVLVQINMLKRSFGRDITFTNNIRMTMRNTNY